MGVYVGGCSEECQLLYKMHIQETSSSAGRVSQNLLGYDKHKASGICTHELKHFYLPR